MGKKDEEARLKRERAKQAAEPMKQEDGLADSRAKEEKAPTKTDDDPAQTDTGKPAIRPPRM